MDKVIIRDLALETIVGLYEWERAVKQRLLIDVDMATDIRQAAADDDLLSIIQRFARLLLCWLMTGNIN
jgi:FolB domain-containing protein